MTKRASSSRQSPIKHHSVPQHVLRRFCDLEGILWTYDKEAKKIYPATPKSQGYKEHFYSFQTENGLDNTTIELEFMSQIDGPGSDAINTLLRHETMSDDQAEAFIQFAAAQMIRVETHFNRLEAVMSPILQEMGERLAKHSEEFKTGLIDRLRKTKLGEDEISELMASLERGEFTLTAHRSYIVATFLQNLDTVRNEFRRMGWNFLDSDNGNPQFVTSDNPLVLTETGPNQGRPLGIRNPNIEITMPLSPTMVAVASWDGGRSYGILEKESIDAVNQRTINQASRFVYAPYKSEDLLAQVVESQGRQARTVVKRIEKNGELYLVPVYAQP